MKPEDKKYIWWGLLGIGVAALFYFLSANKKSTSDTVTVPYLVPTTGASPTAGTSLSNQPNIVGTSPNSTIPNYTNPYSTSANAAEAPGTWGFMPNLLVNSPSGPINTIQSGHFTSGFNFSAPSSGIAPYNTLPTPQTGNPMVIG